MTEGTRPGRPGGARRAPRSIRLTRRERVRMRRQQAGRRAVRPTATRASVTRPADTRPAARPDAPSPRRAVDAALAGQARTAGRRGSGRRALRPPHRRVTGLGGTLGLTFLSAVVPGSGYLYAGRRVIGAVVLLGWAVIAGLALWHFGRDWRNAIDFALEPGMLKIAAAVLGALLLVWAVVVWTSYRLVRPRERPRWHTVVGNVAVVLICVLVAAPVVRAAQYAVATADFVDQLFVDNDTATIPRDVSAKDPWADRERVNVLLLGGDGGEGREGVRTDTVILASIDTRTGKTVTFSLPRNMANAQFPEGSPLHELYPYGFSNGDPASGDYMLNAIYRNIPALHPGVLGKSNNEGADAIKQAVEGSLGIPVEYYVLVNLEGFKQLVDAMGGVTVNINEPVAIGGNTDAGIPPTDYLEPGPNQHLDGFHALWFARGRWGSDDYERMERQRCMIDAIVQAANPANLLVRYLDLLDAGEDIVYTDIPRELASAFVQLGLRVKNSKVKSVVFRTSEEFSSADPDFEYMHETVQKALDPPPKKAKPEGERRNPAVEAKNACAYDPSGETGAVTAAQ